MMAPKSENKNSDNKLRKALEFKPTPLGGKQESSKRQCVLCRVFKRARKGK